MDPYWQIAAAVAAILVAIALWELLGAVEAHRECKRAAIKDETIERVGGHYRDYARLSRATRWRREFDPPPIEPPPPLPRSWPQYRGRR